MIWHGREMKPIGISGMAQVTMAFQRLNTDNLDARARRHGHIA